MPNTDWYVDPMTGETIIFDIDTNEILDVLEPEK